MKAIDVHGFGGGFTLGTVEAGFKLVGKMSLAAGFGVYATLANRHLLGYDWESILGPAPAANQNAAPPAWEVMEADYVFGNPPCSGFSTLSPKSFRGNDSAINACMWQLVDYAAKVKPKIVAWESVQQTFRQGLTLMRMLHDHLEEVSGLKYNLFHVLHNNASVGGVSNRKRYFWVAVQEGIEFGVEHSRVTREGEIRPPTTVPTLGDMLHDLDTIGLSMASQAYRGVTVHHRRNDHGIEHSPDESCDAQCKVTVDNSSSWVRRECHDGTGMVDGQQIAHSPTFDRIQQLLRLEPWAQGERMSDVMRRYYERTGDVPDLFDYQTKKRGDDGEWVYLSKAQRLIETNFAMGHNQPSRWREDRPANVVTGGGVHLVVHPYRDRTLTQREVARIQGFPDDWKIWPIRNAADLGPAWGKGVPVQAGRWISKWAYESINGRPGSDTGVTLEQYDKRLFKNFGPRDRESIIDLTYAYRPYLQESS